MKASQQYYLQYAGHVDFERQQASDEGREISSELIGMYEKIAALAADDSLKEQMAALYLDEMGRMPIRADYPYVEPSNLQGIVAERPEGGRQRSQPVNGIDIADKVYGAWLGRSAGCLLGQPVEGWSRCTITGLLKETGNLPVRYYMSSDIEPAIAEKYGVRNARGSYGNEYVSWINNVKHMVEDDDMNYTILGLAIVEKYGFDFTPDDVSEAWMNLLPVLRTCTAERIAYRNLLNGIDPPQSASYRNAYREWIGAQIRADFFGYINAGNPEKAAEMAWRDASISHVKNGIYGEMWVAAMLAAAAAEDDIEEIIAAGLGQIPSKCRLAEEIGAVLRWHRESISYDEVVERIHGKYDENNPHHWCHTISNAMIVAAALLYGKGDLEATIGMAVIAGFDTDCNAATTGSIVGMRIGAKQLPDKWIQPLNDKTRSGVDGFGLAPLSQLADRTVRLIERNPYVLR